MQRIRTTVISADAPKDTYVEWIDVSNTDSPVPKIYSNGEWKPLSSSGGGSGSDSLEFIVMENSEWLKASSIGSTYSTKAEACAAAGITEELWDSLLSGECTPDLLFTFSDVEEGRTGTLKVRCIFLAHADINSSTQEGSYATWKLFIDPGRAALISIKRMREYIEPEIGGGGEWGPYLYTVTGVNFAAAPEQEMPNP